ncbi:hypothetical protein [Sphaerothrix gracilis]|uniref:hypothetical protein n=1 Tax=Sphaerothrix gracilis TaxID=3151835 RepID=UPI0031FE09D7
MMFYFLPASFVFSVLLRGLVKDEAADKADMGLWLVIFLATVLWPITLPSILYKKVFQRTHQEKDTEWASA